MIALDLCCGKGGWAAGFIAEGWHVIGIDIEDFSAVYPGEFIRGDLLTWEGWKTSGARIVLASTPCEQFSRWSMPWTRKKNPPKPSLELWNRAEFIARELGVPLIQENVRGAQEFLGRSKFNCGPFHLWGDVPPLVPVFEGKKKESYGSKQRADRAIIPLALSRHFARIFAQSERRSA